MTEDEKLDYEAMMIREEILISQEMEELTCRRRSRHRFLFWLTVYMAYWGYIIYALVTLCPFFGGGYEYHFPTAGCYYLGFSSIYACDVLFCFGYFFDSHCQSFV